MEQTGKLFKKLEKETGDGAKGEWQKQQFVIEIEGKYPTQICFTAWGDMVNELENYKPGDLISVNFNAKSREWKERWFTDLNCYAIGAAEGDNKGKGTHQKEIPQGKEDNAPSDDLPF